MMLVQGQAYRAQYGFDAIHLLMMNLYGPGDHFDAERSHVVPALIRRLLEATAAGAEEITVWGDGRATREFLYVADAARGILLAAERYDDARPVNLGAGFEVSVRELAILIAELTGFRGRLVFDASKPSGQQRRSADVSRAREAFGFEAGVSLREGLKPDDRLVRADGAGGGRAMTPFTLVILTLNEIEGVTHIFPSCLCTWWTRCWWWTAAPPTGRSSSSRLGACRSSGSSGGGAARRSGSPSVTRVTTSWSSSAPTATRSRPTFRSWWRGCPWATTWSSARASWRAAARRTTTSSCSPAAAGAT